MVKLISQVLIDFLNTDLGKLLTKCVVVIIPALGFKYILKLIADLIGLYSKPKTRKAIEILSSILASFVSIVVSFGICFLYDYLNKTNRDQVILTIESIAYGTAAIAFIWFFTSPTGKRFVQGLSKMFFFWRKK